MDVPLYFQQTIANGVTIDWGDGSATETLDGTDKVTTTHRYASIGDYMISLDVVDGCTLGLGHESYSYCVMGSTGNNGIVYCNMLQKVEIGTGVTSIRISSFLNCNSLKSVTLPNSVTFIETYAFRDCYSLSLITIPISVISIALYVFQNCSSLSSITIPDSVTSIGSYVFNFCYSLPSLKIPNGVTSIGSATFYNCYSMAYYDFTSHTAVPTLENTNAFTSIPADCKIIVPDNLYDTWIAATNWSAYATYTIKKSDWDNLKQGGSL